MKFHSRWAATAIFIVASGVSTLAHAVSVVPVQGTWASTLQGRDLDGNLSTFEAYYDTSLNITWLADTNYNYWSMTWYAANVWATSLNINGYTGWRLPIMTDTGTLGCNFAYSGTDCGYNVTSGEMAHMFYITLGNKAYYDTSGFGLQPGWGLTNAGPFSNMGIGGPYWYGTDDGLHPGDAWYFDSFMGYQDSGTESWYMSAWAVHSGDVGAVVPVPAAAWLFGSGLLGLAGIARRKARAA